MLTQSSPVRDGCSRAWSLFSAGGVLAAAVAFSGVGFADDKKPEPKAVEFEIVIVDDGKPAGDKKAVERKIEMKVVNDDVQKLTKAVSVALEKGDVEAAKKLMAKLEATLKATPRTRIVEAIAPAAGAGDRVTQYRVIDGKAVAPAAPGEWTARVAPPVAVAGSPLQGFYSVQLAQVDEGVKRMEEKLASLKKALESVKDSPEAREALEKTIAEYRKKIDEARKSGEFKMKAAPPAAGANMVPGAEGVWLFAAQDAEAAKVWQAQAEKAHAQAAAEMVKAKAEMERLAEALAAAKGDPEMQAKIKDKMAQMHKKIADSAKPNASGSGLSGRVVNRSGEGRLGVVIDVVPDVLIDQFDLPKGQCILVKSIMDGTPAAKAGVKPNDVMMIIAGKPVPANAEDLAKLVAGLKADEQFDIIVLRKGKKETVKGVTLPAPAKREKKREASDSGDAAGGMKFNSMSVNVNDGEFTIDAKNDDVKIHIVGHFEDGKPVADRVSGSRDGIDFATKDLSSLAKSDRAIIDQLLKNVRGGKQE